MKKQYFVYIMASRNNRVLYTGMTNNLKRRASEHRSGKGGVFTSKYKAVKLVYYEIAAAPSTAIRREKQIKAGSRWRKEELINGMNPTWKDLYPEI